MNYKKTRSLAFQVLLFGALAGLFYFLLPVSPQSLLSADHVRWAFASADISPVLNSSLTSVWAGLLWLLRSVGLGVEHQTFATAAALSAWISLAAVAVLSRYVSKWTLLFVAISPAVLWSSVVPNGTSVTLLVLALMGIWCAPEMTIEKSRARWTLGAVLEGLGCALTPFAWPLALTRAYRQRTAVVPGRTRILRGLLFIAGFSFSMAIAVLLDSARGTSASFAMLPVFSALRLIGRDDTLSAGRVIFGNSEIFISFLASFSFMAAAFQAPGWPTLVSGHRTKLGFVFINSSLILLLLGGHPSAWRMAHPGWNTILEDFAQNVERGLLKPTIAIVRTRTEESALRYVDALLAKSRNVIAVRSVDLFGAVTLERIRHREPRFTVDEANQALNSGVGLEDPKKFLLESVLVPNVARGVQFWVDSVPDRSEGFEVQFLSTGIRVSSNTGPTKFITDRNVLRESYIRARPTLKEYLAGTSVETDVFAKYALIHLAMARIQERDTQVSDSAKRARGEYYSALKKVEWLKDIHQKVCVEPALEEAKKTRSKSAAATKPEPLDICADTAWHYGK
jgi:hypothetical protein